MGREWLGRDLARLRGFLQAHEGASVREKQEKARDFPRSLT
jgi:hypothetical protein